jgi:hypothetical protein
MCVKNVNKRKKNMGRSYHHYTRCKQTGEVRDNAHAAKVKRNEELAAVAEHMNAVVADLDTRFTPSDFHDPNFPHRKEHVKKSIPTTNTTTHLDEKSV